MSLFLIPGFMADATLWDDMAAALGAFGPLHHADLRHDATLAAMAQRALAQAPPSFVLVGFSMGGYVARLMARMAPQRVQALILIASSTRPDAPARRHSKIAIGTAAQHLSFGGLSRAAIASSLHPLRRSNLALIERVRAMGVRLGGDAFQRQSLLERPDDRPYLHEIVCPTLIVAAANDQLRGLDEATELHVGIAGSTLEVIDDCGHMIPLEAPERLAALMTAWLQATLYEPCRYNDI